MLFTAICLCNCTAKKPFKPKAFSTQQEAVIIQADSVTPMRIYKITNAKDSIVLRQKSSDIIPNPKNKILSRFIKRLYSTVRDSSAMGVGIAAPQVGILKNIIWVQRFDKEGFPFEVYLNPKITTYSTNTQTVKEGCLSIPDQSATLSNRSETINISYQTQTGKRIIERVSGFTAVIFQHEIDHLNGILYLDHLAKDALQDK